MGTFLFSAQHISTSASHPLDLKSTSLPDHAPICPALLGHVFLTHCPEQSLNGRGTAGLHTSVMTAVKNSLWGKEVVEKWGGRSPGVNAAMSASLITLPFYFNLPVLLRKTSLHVKGPHKADVTPTSPCVYSVHFYVPEKTCVMCHAVPREAWRDEQASVSLIYTCTSHTCPSRLYDTTV